MSVGAQALRLVGTLVFCLLLTTAIECTVAAGAFGIRNRHDLATVALAQLATNPAVVALSLVAYELLPSLAWGWAALLLLELLATTAEALLYKASAVSDRPWLLSATCNLLSFLLGLLLL